MHSDEANGDTIRDDGTWDGDSTVARQSERRKDAEHAFVLVGVSGAAAGKRYPVQGAAPHRFYCGKSERCDAPVGDPEVSRRHFALETRNGALHITDLDSTNGTFVNGVRVIEAELYGGESIRVGTTSLRVVIAEQATARVPSGIAFGRVLGQSASMRKLFPFCIKLANSMLPVVIEGETGTGKELLAESLHEQGPRARGPFVVFDCTTVAPSLVEASLFGYERGAYTGAETSQPGVFERAHGGTLFIDEIGDLALNLQARLLRAVERCEVRRIGGDRYRKVDVRILCATRRDLERAIEEGRFRDDLFHRLAIGRLELPPLRHRHGDVRLLAQYFWDQLGGGQMPTGLLDKLERHPFPGNVRELRNILARASALGDLAPVDLARDNRLQAPSSRADGGPATVDDVIAHVLADGTPFTRARDIVMAEFRRRFVAHALERNGGSVPKAAAAAGVSRRYFDMIRGKDDDSS